MNHLRTRPGKQPAGGWLLVWGLVTLVVVIVIYALPLQGQVTIRAGGGNSTGGTQPLWPQITISPQRPQPGELVTVEVIDAESWANVLLTVAGKPATFVEWQETNGLYVWRWTFSLPQGGQTAPLPVEFFYDCNTGCKRRGQAAFGPAPAARTAAAGLPTKLCVAFADPERNWHGRRGWVVDIAYARLADETEDRFWNVDALAERVYQATEAGVRVLVRVEYDRDQSLPPRDDFLALSDYLSYVRRLARDDRLAGVYGYVIGSGPNAIESNAQAADRPVTAEWYARIFNGFGEPPLHADNVVQAIRNERPAARVLVGPVRPFVESQTGAQPFALNVPWLNYMNTLVAGLDASMSAKSEAGFGVVGPDGFALHAPGRPDAPELGQNPPAEEPRHDLPRSTWQGAQAGFRVYQDWIQVIDSYASMRGLPVYITATNTFVPDGGTPPAQNYPAGWLTTAYQVVNADPRVHALCWFLDQSPGDGRWDAFSLERQPGRMIYAAEEFDALLQE